VAKRELSSLLSRVKGVEPWDCTAGDEASLVTIVSVAVPAVAKKRDKREREHQEVLSCGQRLCGPVD
jgi:hypothetical protein